MIEKMQAGLTGDFRAMGNGKYLYYPEASPVILQLELMESDTLLVYFVLLSMGVVYFYPLL